MNQAGVQTKAVGSRIPANDEHAVSFWLPTWDDIIDNGEGRLAGKIQAGYPRFHIHPKVEKLIETLLAKHDREGLSFLVFPTRAIGKEAAEWVTRFCKTNPLPTIIDSTVSDGPTEHQLTLVGIPDDDFHTLKQFWRLSGQGVSSRYASYLLDLLNGTVHGHSAEEKNAKNRIQQSIASLVSSPNQKVSSDAVWLFPNGLASLFNADQVCRTIQRAEETGAQSVCFGFPFADTLKMLQHKTPANTFYPSGSSEELDALEELLEGGGKVFALFCEIVSNPLMKTPDLKRIRSLANKYGFLVVVDDTIAGYANIDILPYADISIASLTKIFNGACNLMAGALVVSPYSRYYEQLQAELKRSHSNIFWIDDAVELERNSRDFVERNRITNQNAEAIVEILGKSPIVEQLYYPSLVTRELYDGFKRPGGGYGGVVSILFKAPDQAIKFYNALDVCKGPSLGANFILCCPFVMLAHYKELDFAIDHGVPQYLIRVSAGLEDTEVAVEKIRNALTATGAHEA